MRRNLCILWAGDQQALHRRYKTLQLIHNASIRRPNLVLACANSNIQSMNHTWNMGVCLPVTYIRSVLSRQARTGLKNLWHAYTQRHVERFPWHAAFTAVPFQPLCIVKNMCLYTHLPDCAEIVYELPLLPNNTAEIFLHKSGAVGSGDWIFIIGSPAWRWSGEYVILDRTFYNLLFKQDVVKVPFTSKIFFRVAFLDQTFIRKIIQKLYYTFIIQYYYNIY